MKILFLVFFLIQPLSLLASDEAQSISEEEIVLLVQIREKTRDLFSQRGDVDPEIVLCHLISFLGNFTKNEGAWGKARTAALIYSLDS